MRVSDVSCLPPFTLSVPSRKKTECRSPGNADSSRVYHASGAGRDVRGPNIWTRLCRYWCRCVFESIHVSCLPADFRIGYQEEIDVAASPISCAARASRCAKSQVSAHFQAEKPGPRNSRSVVDGVESGTFRDSVVRAISGSIWT